MPPLLDYDQYMQSLTRGAGLTLPRSPSQFPPYTPEEEQSLLSRIGTPLLSGIGYVGSLFDKLVGGRAVRGLLGGRPEELASLIPGSDVLGITRPENAVSGRNLLEKAGMIEPAQPGFQWGDLSGIGAEILTSPASWLSLGGTGVLTGAGKAAAKAGTLAPTRAARIAAGQSGLFGVHLPWPLGGAESGIAMGTGPMAENIAGKLGRAGDWLRYSGPGRAAANLLQKKMGGASSEIMQRAMNDLAERLPAAEQAARAEVYDPLRTLAESGQLREGGLTDPFDTVRQLRENALSPQPGFPTPLVAPEVASVAGTVGENLAKRYAAGAEVGRGTQELENFFPRQAIPVDKATKGFEGGGKPLEPWNVHQLHRDPEFMTPVQMPTIGPKSVAELSTDLMVSGRDRLLRGGEVSGAGPQTVQDMLSGTFTGPKTMEQELALERLRLLRAGPKTLTAPEREMLSNLKNRPAFGAEADYIRENYLNWTPADEARMTQLKDPTYLLQIGKRYAGPAADELAQLEKRYAQGNDLAKRAAGFDPKRAAEGIPLFGRPGAADLLHYNLADARATAKAETIQDVIAKLAQPASAIEGDTVPLTQALAEHANLKGPNAQLFAVQKLIQQGKLNPGTLPDHLDFLNMAIPRANAEEIARVMKGFAMPESLKPLLGMSDSFTNLYRSLISASLYPWNYMRYARNMGQQSWGMFVAGHDLREIPNAYKVFREGGTLEGSAQFDKYKHLGLTDAQATDLIRRDGFITRQAGVSQITRDTDIIGATGEAYPGKAVQIPGQPQPGIGQILKSSIPTTLEEANPLNIAGGFGGRTTTKSSAVLAGREMDQAIDDVTRGGSLIHLLRKGWTDPVAIENEIKRVHYDYTNLSGAEKAVFRRVMPFYNWTRQNVPAQFKLLMEEPGGKTAMAIRAANDVQQKNQGFIPDYLAGELAIPVGGPDEAGRTRFLSGLGLPFEDAFSHFIAGHGLASDIKRSGESVLAELAPQLRGPLELMTGRQFRTGRELADLAEPTGFLPKDVTMDQLLMNLPTARLMGVGRTAIQKGPLDALTRAATPVHLTDIDLEKAKEQTVRDLILERLRGTEGIGISTTPYVRKGQAPELTPEQIELMRLGATLTRHQMQRAKEQRIGIGR